MFKKKLVLIASFTALTLTSTFVSACGVSLDTITGRPISDPNTYRTYFNFPLTSWSSGVTNKAEDNKILADLLATLVATDKYNRSYGDIAIQEDKSSRLVGQPNVDGTEWTYKISPDAKWFDYTGQFQRRIKASDMINAAKYVLFPKNLSQTFSLWLGFIQGAEEIWSYFQNDYQSKPGIPWYEDDIWSKLGVVVNDQDDAVTFKLVKAVPYFDTLMTYLAFAPLPEVALTKGYNYGNNYRNIWYSGAYLVKEYNSSSRILLRKNNNYRFAKLTYVNQIDYTYFANVDISRPRMLFESGDLSEFIVSPSDSSGWKKYVGSDPNNPKFGSAVKYPNSMVTTYVLMYNFSNTNILNGKDGADKTQALDASKALQYDKIRKFLALNLDRNKFVRYYSEALDSSSTSSFLRNVYTARNFVYNKDKDYSSYVETEYANTYLGGDSAKAADLLKDGSDAYYHNPDLTKDDSNLTAEIRNWLQQNLGKSMLTLKFLMNGANVLTSNKKLMDMIDSFNNSNDIIKIIPDVSVDGTEYLQRTRAGDYDLIISGWSPDFADPFTYLNTFTLKGDLESYYGTNRVFGDIEFNDQGMAPDYDQLQLNNPYWNALKNNVAMPNFYNMFKNYTNQVKVSDSITAETQINQRYGGFAKAEFQALYQDYMFLPLYLPDGTFRMYVSYAVPRTRVTVGYGSSQYKHWGMQLTRYLLNQKQVAQVEDKYQHELEIIKNDYGAFRDDY